MPKLSYVRRLTVDKILNASDCECQYERIWLYVSEQKLATCISFLLAPQKLIKNIYRKLVV